MLNYQQKDKFHIFLHMFQNNSISLRVEDITNFYQSINNNPEKLYKFIFDMYKHYLVNKNKKIISSAQQYYQFYKNKHDIIEFKQNIELLDNFCQQNDLKYKLSLNDQHFHQDYNLPFLYQHYLRNQQDFNLDFQLNSSLMLIILKNSIKFHKQYSQSEKKELKLKLKPYYYKPFPIGQQAKQIIQLLDKKQEEKKENQKAYLVMEFESIFHSLIFENKLRDNLYRFQLDYYLQQPQVENVVVFENQLQKKLQNLTRKDFKIFILPSEDNYLSNYIGKFDQFYRRFVLDVIRKDIFIPNIKGYFLANEKNYKTNFTYQLWEDTLQTYIQEADQKLKICIFKVKCELAKNQIEYLEFCQFLQIPALKKSQEFDIVASCIDLNGYKYDFKKQVSIKELHLNNVETSNFKGDPCCPSEPDLQLSFPEKNIPKAGSSDEIENLYKNYKVIDISISSKKNFDIILDGNKILNIQSIFVVQSNKHIKVQTFVKI